MGIQIMSDLVISKASENDMPQIMAIYEQARQFMKETGNATQWKDNYPPQALLWSDIAAGQLYVVKDDDCIHGVFVFFIGEDDTYKVIEDGSWMDDTEYGVIHRVASDGKVRGMVRTVAEYCSGRISHLRIDTHNDNKVMQRALEKCGFRKCGIIHIEDGSPRIAYEMV